MGKYKYDFYAEDFPKGVDWDDYFAEFDKFFQDEMDKSKALPKGLQVGKIFSIGVADGSAYYEITKIFKARVHLKWRRELCPDHYMDHHFCQGGSFEKWDVE